MIHFGQGLSLGDHISAHIPTPNHTTFFTSCFSFFAAITNQCAACYHTSPGMRAHYHIVSRPDGLFENRLHDGNVGREILRWIAIGNRRKLRSVHGVASRFKLGDDQRVTGGVVPRSWKEYNMGFSHLRIVVDKQSQNVLSEA